MGFIISYYGRLFLGETWQCGIGGVALPLDSHDPDKPDENTRSVRRSSCLLFFVKVEKF